MKSEFSFKGKREEAILKEVLVRFFKTKPIRMTLKFLEKQDMFGFENWLQIELIRFLYETKGVSDGYIAKEDPHEQDGRTNDDRYTQKIDLTFKPKGWEYFIALEIKVKRNLALTAVCQDLEKLRNCKPASKCYYRKGFSLLIHQYRSPDHIEKKLSNKTDEVLLETSNKIPGTKLSYSVFSCKI